MTIGKFTKRDVSRILMRNIIKCNKNVNRICAGIHKYDNKNNFLYERARNVNARGLIQLACVAKALIFRATFAAGGVAR